MQFKSIVVGVDGSDTARKALSVAADLVGAGGTIHVVTAFDAPSLREINDLYAHVPAEFLADVDMLAGDRLRLQDAIRFLEDRHIECKDHFVDDDPASAILDVADDVEADLIVVGSRGMGRARRFLRGSVSAKIATHARTTFLVVHD